MFENEAARLTSKTDRIDLPQLLAAVDGWARDRAQVPGAGLGYSETSSKTSGPWLP